jgi:hypothetical protein
VRWKIGIVVFLFAWSLTTHGKYSATGDEPHFLIITHSIIADHDLDVGNNYANDDGRYFIVSPSNLKMELHAAPAKTGRIRSVHDVGLAVALVPAYWIAQRVAQLPSLSLLARFRMDRGLFAYSIIGLFLIALTATGLVLLASALTAVTSPRAAALLVVAAGISPPIVSHSFLVFPEVLALFVTCLVVWFSMKPAAPRDGTAFIAMAFVLGLLTWSHHKYLLYAPGLLFVILWMRWPLIRTLSSREQAIAAALFVLPQLALHWWTWREWGTLGGTLTTNDVPLSFTTLQRGAVGLFMDRQSGLLAYAPLYWVLPACCFLDWRRSWPVLIPVTLLFLPAASFTHGWWAGFSPAARYIVALTPFFLVTIAGSLRYRAVRVALVLLMIPQALIDAVIWQYPRTLWPSTLGNTALQTLGVIGRAYERLLPPVQTGEPLWTAIQLAAVAAVATAALIALALAEKRALLARQVGWDR